MSYAGSILDKLITIAETVDADYKTERGVDLTGLLNDEDFPHIYAYEPKMAITPLPFLQESVSGDFTILIVTKGETQEEVNVRADAIRAAVKADNTLTGDVDLAYVSSIEVFEDPRDGKKWAKIIVSTEEDE
jgi:hypothetical protein